VAENQAEAQAENQAEAQAEAQAGAQAGAQAEALVVVATDQAQAEAMVAVKVSRLAKNPGTVTSQPNLPRRCFIQEWVTRMGEILDTEIQFAKHKSVTRVAATATQVMPQLSRWETWKLLLT